MQNKRFPDFTMWNFGSAVLIQDTRDKPRASNLNLNFKNNQQAKVFFECWFVRWLLAREV